MNNSTIAIGLFGIVVWISKWARAGTAYKKNKDPVDEIRAAVGGRPKAAICRLFDPQTPLSSRRKIVHFVRHGEGIHNVAAAGQGCKCDSGRCPYVDPSLTDPKLTERGRTQAAALQVRGAQARPELVVVSPHVRTIQSALIVFEKCSVPYVALECIRERYGKHTCDKRNSASKTGQMFEQVDMTTISEEDILWSPTREPQSSVVDRAFQFVEWLKNRPEHNIAVVSHSSFLLTLFNAALDTSAQPSLAEKFDVSELRSVILEFV